MAAGTVIACCVVLLGTWASASSGRDRAAAMAVTAVLLACLHVALVRAVRPRLSPHELMVASLLSGGLLASFALAMALTVASLNTTLYEQSKADLSLAGSVTFGFAALLLGHGAASRRAVRRLPRPRRSGDLSP